MLSDEWLSRYGLLENFNASVTRTGTGTGTHTGTGTWTTGVTAIALCTSCSRAKNPSIIIFSETNRLISRKLGVRHRWLKYSNVYINHDPVMTLTKFMARSTWVACASELGKLLKCHLKEKANRKLANGQNIEDSEKRKWPKGLSSPALELNTIIFKHVYWYMQLISGERLQDHWSSGLKCIVQIFNHVMQIPIKVMFSSLANVLKRCKI